MVLFDGDCTEPKQGFIQEFLGQTTGTKLSANPAPKLNHSKHFGTSTDAWLAPKSAGHAPR